MMMKTAAILVTYNPTIKSLLQLIESLLVQTEKVIIVDNNSSNLQCWQVLLEKYEKVVLLALDRNYGIAYAQNQGIKYAQGSEYVIYFDQDSTIGVGFIHALELGYEKMAAGSKKIAAVGPVFVDERYGFYYPLIHFNKIGIRSKISPERKSEPFEVSVIISSGMLVHQDVLSKIGLMNEKFFIDYVDTEWCLRAQGKGYAIFAIPSAVMLHTIGDSSIKLWRWRIPVHSPFRRYYRIRNSLYMLKLQHVPKLLAVREVCFAVLHQSILIALCDKRKDNWKVLWRALKDGLLTNPR